MIFPFKIKICTPDFGFCFFLLLLLFFFLGVGGEGEEGTISMRKSDHIEMEVLNLNMAQADSGIITDSFYYQIISLVRKYKEHNFQTDT